MDVMRTLFKEGTLQHLLDTQPVVSGGTGGGGEEGVAASTSALATEAAAAAAAGGSDTPRMKSCDLCRKNKPMESFRIVSGDSLSAYCRDCDRLIGRGRRLGLSIDDIRTAQDDNTIDSLLGMAFKDEGDTSGMATGAPVTDPVAVHGVSSARRLAGVRDSDMVGDGDDGPFLKLEEGTAPGSLARRILDPQSCVMCGNTFVPKASGETLCTCALLHI
jgi:hypothetical protein